MDRWPLPSAPVGDMSTSPLTVGRMTGGVVVAVGTGAVGVVVGTGAVVGVGVAAPTVMEKVVELA